jgi:hypothetical protein
MSQRPDRPTSPLTGDEAWLALADAELEAICPDWEPGVRPDDDSVRMERAARELDNQAAAVLGSRGEAFGAGFTHGKIRLLEADADSGPGYGGGSPTPRPAGSARGFGTGGPCDSSSPGPVLARMALDAHKAGLRSASDDELIGLLCAARRLASWQAAAELTVVAELDARRRAAAARRRQSWAASTAGSDGASQTGGQPEPMATSSDVSKHTSAELAAALTLTGRASDDLLWFAREMKRLPCVLHALECGRIDVPKARVFAQELAALSDAKANEIAARFVLRAPKWTTAQLRRALRAAVLAADPKAGERRSRKARDDARVELFTEGSGNAGLAGRELPPAQAIAADERLSQIARALKSNGVPGNMDQLRASVFLALLTGTDPAGLLGDGTGQPAAADDAGLPAGNPGLGAATGSGRPAGQGDPAAAAGHITLTLPAATWLGLADRPGDLAGFGPLDPYTCRHLADLAREAGASWHVTLTDDHGHAVAHACARGRPPPHPGADGRSGAGPPGAAPPGMPAPDPRLHWLAGLAFNWFEQAPCGHSRQTSAYQPGKKLRHLLAVRNPTCTFPGCRRPAAWCDNEHTVPFDQGGRTCECNCGPMCRPHHNTKQQPGWRLDQPVPGTFVWTAPSGRQYVSYPDEYPA